MRRGITKRVREAASRLGCFTRPELLNEMGAQTYAEAEQVRCAIKDLKKIGDLRSIRRGIYEYAPKRKRRVLDIVWHLIRSHRQFTAREIERLSGASIHTLHEYFTGWRKQGHLRYERGCWKLVEDPGPETPDWKEES